MYINKDNLVKTARNLLNKVTSVALTGINANSELTILVAEFKHFIDPYCEFTGENVTRYNEAVNTARDRIGKAKNRETYIILKSQLQEMIDTLHMK